jgi:hypothetical protein
VILSGHQPVAHVVPLCPNLFVRAHVDVVPTVRVAVVLVSEDRPPFRVHHRRARFVPHGDADQAAYGLTRKRFGQDCFGADRIGRVEDALEAAGVALDADGVRRAPVGGFEAVVEAREHGNVALGLGAGAREMSAVFLPRRSRLFFLGKGERRTT